MNRKRVVFVACLVFLGMMVFSRSCIAKTLSEQEAVSQLKSSNASYRLDAVQALKNYKTTTSVSSLIEALNDKESFIRASAIVALQFIKDIKAVPELINIVEKSSENPVVLKSAVTALGAFKDKRALLALAKAAKSSDKTVKQSAIMALREIEGGEDAAYDVLLDATDDSDANVRREAATSLSVKSDTISDESKKEKIRAKLEKMSKNDNNKSVKKAAGDSFERVRKVKK